MSVKGQLLLNGVGVGGGRDDQTAFNKAGLIVQPPTTGPFKKAPLPFCDPIGVVDFFDDFFTFIKDTTDIDGWVVWNGGVNNYDVTLGSNAGKGGELAIQSTDPANTSDIVTVRTNQPIIHTISNKPVWFGCRLLGYSHAYSDVYVGLMSYTGTPDPTDVAKMIHLVGFEIPPTMYPTVIIRNNGNALLGQSMSSRVTDQVYNEYGFYIDDSNVEYYINGQLVYTKERGTNIPSAPLYPFVSVKATSTTQHAALVDYIRSICYR